MTTIDACIAAGDFERAALIAASLSNPAGHRNAMIRIFNARQSKGRPMKFDLSEVKATTMHYTPCRELHGEDPEPAATLTFDVQLSASLLAMFHPTLRWSLFHNPNKPTNGGESPIDDANDLRYPEVQNPIKWKKDIVGGTLTIHHGIGGDSDIVLPTKKVDDFQIEPLAAGVFNLHFRARCHPDERQHGALAMMQDGDPEFSFEPPEAGVGADLADQAMREPAGAEA